MAQTTVTVSATASHPIPTALWGQMFESGDGGLYAELLQNRAFQVMTPGTTAALLGWKALKATIAVIADSKPVSSALPNSLQLTIPAGNAVALGFANTGFSGIKVTAGTTYKASFYYRFPTASTFSGTISASLQSSTGAVLGVQKVSVVGSQTTWKQVQLSIAATTTPSSTANTFAITVDGTSPSEDKINFAMLSLFPPTFKNRANGMRADIAQALADMKPSFFRLPGGNNLEGPTIAARWQWNATVGPLLNRPGRLGDWGYVNTDGFGLFEHLTWCEDLNMQPIMAVWAGYALTGASPRDGTSVAEADFGPYIQQAIDQINFVIGDPAKSAAAALRSSLGHPAPFALKYVEIGNEDFFGSTTYVYRWKDMVTALKAQFPTLHFIATSNVGSPVLTPKPTEYDIHVYDAPTWFVQNTFYYDGFKRDGTQYFEGEYAVTKTPAVGRLPFPTLESAVAEAAFMTGLERNSDIVFAAAYAPLLGSVVTHQWTPNLLAFDAGSVYKSTSFYVQQLFSVNRGDQYLPSTLPSKTGTVFWSVVRNTPAGQIIIKISNTATTATTLTFVLPFKTVATKGTIQLLGGGGTNETLSNTPANPTLFVPVTSSINTAKTFNYVAPASSVSVLTITAS
ncbi:hypothetical protein GALMADRAFT_227157 [Galerina marginata CBS 339.88]|uniref:non-reducing end alpha-L-arabinofuranosidase n=1 Tax=Galerina marginata (strain CBS 339.88) TaxID=685588 RepID=A0A067SV39_GALM3|nr:hypothetical protein GALMADRAFT_227157 [Galerina marginata CBS 339.88]